MEKLILKTPTKSYSKQIWDYKQAFEVRGENLAGCNTLEKCSSVDQWLHDVTMFSQIDTCPKGYVPSSLYLAIREVDDTLVGIIDIRHHIDHPILSQWGGHIGYSVIHNQRQKGYAKEMLRLALIKCQELGIDQVLITCDQNNIASKKTIVANGGIFEKTILVDGKTSERYWIKTK